MRGAPGSDNQHASMQGNEEGGLDAEMAGATTTWQAPPPNAQTELNEEGAGSSDEMVGPTETPSRQATPPNPPNERPAPPASPQPRTQPPSPRLQAAASTPAATAGTAGTEVEPSVANSDPSPGTVAITLTRIEDPSHVQHYSTVKAARQVIGKTGNGTFYKGTCLMQKAFRPLACSMLHAARLVCFVLAC